jgi:hypothetical protein
MEKGTNLMTSTKVIGAMKHLLLELEKVGVINEIDREHLLDRYIRGRIESFGHLAEYMRRFYSRLENHNYIQIIRYGNHYGESNFLLNAKGEMYLTDPDKPVK